MKIILQILQAIMIAILLAAMIEAIREDKPFIFAFFGAIFLGCIAAVIWENEQ